MDTIIFLDVLLTWALQHAHRSSIVSTINVSAVPYCLFCGSLVPGMIVHGHFHFTYCTDFAGMNTMATPRNTSDRSITRSLQLNIYVSIKIFDVTAMRIFHFS